MGTSLVSQFDNNPERKDARILDAFLKLRLLCEIYPYSFRCVLDPRWLYRSDLNGPTLFSWKSIKWLDIYCGVTSKNWLTPFCRNGISIFRRYTRVTFDDKSKKKNKQQRSYARDIFRNYVFFKESLRKKKKIIG